MNDTPEQTSYDLRGKRIWVCGHRGMVGAALVRRLEAENPAEILTVGRTDVDLTQQADVTRWMYAHRPDAVFIAAAKVGGILANATYPADFLYDNLMIAANVIHAAHNVGVEKLVFLGSSCIYPKLAEQPIREDSLLTGPLEPTNEAYAIAKIAGVKLCEAYRTQHGDDFVSAMPTNLYGPGDNFHLENSHVIPALMRKAHEAKLSGSPTLTLWGKGQVRREFMHVDDCADGLVFVMKHLSRAAPVNVGSGADITIAALANEIKSVVGFDGALTFDTSKPDGTPRKLMDNSVLSKMGWTPQRSLRDGLAQTYLWFLSNQEVLRRV